MRILFHAVNGFGVGHVVRLALISHAVCEKSDPTVMMVSSSPAASQYFRGECRLVCCDLSDGVGHAEEVRTLVSEFKPDVVVFDTRWPRGICEYLAGRRVKRVLVLRAWSLKLMKSLALLARLSFERVLLPHTYDELTYYYESDPKLMETLRARPFIAVGPIARVSDSPSRASTVLFTLGAGKPYETDVNVQMEMFIRTAEILYGQGRRDLRLLIGPFAEFRTDLAPLTPVRDNAAAHEQFGPNCCVVSRGGYNTCWEAIAAGSHLVVSNVPNRQKPWEDIEARSQYLSSRGWARNATAEPGTIADAVLLGHAPNVASGRGIVNCGLGDVVRSICE